MYEDCGLVWLIIVIYFGFISIGPKHFLDFVSIL